jgi:outer membrane protein assembly factor BamE (lipoprotein component of BamABCDE complex)
VRGLLLAFVVAFGSTLLPPCAGAQTTLQPQPRFQRAGWGFSCAPGKVQLPSTPNGRQPSDAACGQVGPLSLGMARADAEKVLGTPTTTKSLGNNVFYVYSLQTDEAHQMVTFAVVAYDSARRVRSIQLSGLPWPGAWSFADIRLGDPGPAVIARLGEPHGASPGSETGTLLWDYLPWTFSFEVKGARVSSIRVTE